MTAYRRGVILEERRQLRECFILCSALGMVIYIFPADSQRQLHRCELHGTSALPSFRSGRASIALYRPN